MSPPTPPSTRSLRQRVLLECHADFARMPLCSNDHVPQHQRTSSAVGHDHYPQVVGLDHYPQAVGHDHYPQVVGHDHYPQVVDLVKLLDLVWSRA